MSSEPFNPFELVKSDFLDHEGVRQRLKLFISDLLENDFERLCALMYRHDVNEAAFSEALTLPTDEKRAAAIAELVIAREMQKMETRAAYAREKNKDKLNEGHHD